MAGDYCLCADPKASMFIESIFRECRAGGTDISILVLQYISTIIWLFALLPQVRLSYLAKISDVSIVFSIIWTFADTLSLISMFLTGVMISQKVMQIYFVAVDVVLFLQVLYYKRHQNIPKLSLEMRDWEKSTYTLIVVCVIVGIAMFYWQNKEVIEMQMDLLGSIEQNMNCNEQGTVENKKVLLAGQIIGYISIPFFPLSRITQIIATFRTKHVDGISPLMFCLTISGNTIQFVSLIIDAIYYNRVVDQLPFMCNAILPALLDVVIIIQYKKYSKKQDKDQKEQNNDQVEEQPIKRPRQQSVREKIMQSIDLSDYQDQIGNNKATQTGEDETKQNEPRDMKELQVSVEVTVSQDQTKAQEQTSQ